MEALSSIQEALAASRVALMVNGIILLAVGATLYLMRTRAEAQMLLEDRPGQATRAHDVYRLTKWPGRIAMALGPALLLAAVITPAVPH